MGKLFGNNVATEGSLSSAVAAAIEEQPRKKASAKWQPTEWRLEYEKVVAMDAIGLSGVEIARRTGYSAQHVYNILGTPQAVAIQEQLIELRRKHTEIDVNAELTEIEQLTVKRLKSALQDDDIFARSPLGLIGKGLEVMKGRGEHLKNQPGTVNNFNAGVMPDSVWQKFMAGMEKANEAKALIAARDNIEDAVVIENKEDAA